MWKRNWDELHYFSKCNNALLKVCREKYISHIKKKGERFSLFNETNIAMYAIMFHDDDTIIVDTAKYVKQLMIRIYLWLVGNRLNMSRSVFLAYTIHYCWRWIDYVKKGGGGYTGVTFIFLFNSYLVLCGLPIYKYILFQNTGFSK